MTAAQLLALLVAVVALFYATANSEQ